MAVTITGSASAAATSIAIPTHAVGDLIVLWAYRDGSASAPTKPSASGTVPAWVDILNSGASSTAGRSAWFIATATNHTSGTWTNATGMAAVVLTGTHATTPIGANGHQNGTFTTSCVAPAVTMQNADGSGQLLQFYGHRAVTAWSAAPANYTNLTSVATEVCVNYKNTPTSSAAVTQTTTGSGNYSAEQIEILAPTPPTTFTRNQAAGSGHGGAGGFGPQDATFANAVNSGSLLVCAWWGNSNTGNATCADNINGAWTALTQQTPVGGSGRRMNWFYKTNSASASAGAMVVTVTPNANAGNSEWMQIIEYDATSGIDSAVTAYAAHASGVTAALASGTPTQTGDLVLMAVCSDTESNKTFTANAPLTAIVLDGSSHTAGEANGSATLAVAEMRGASTAAINGSMGIGTTDAGGIYIIGFEDSSGSILTKTQTATARIAGTVTKDQTATARIAGNITKTQTATARIAETRTKTQTATANIANASTVTKDQTATARIAGTVTKTQTATARIANVLTKTQTAIARIANSVTKTQTATARIATSSTKTQTATGRIATSNTKTQTATASIAGAQSTKTQTAIARIQNTCTKTQTATARITQNDYVFSPPVTQGDLRTDGRPKKDNRFWRHFHPQLTGVSVLKIDGEYVEIVTPTQTQISAAEIAYIGGHEHHVSQTEAAALEAAGYDVEVRAL